MSLAQGKGVARVEGRWGKVGVELGGRPEVGLAEDPSLWEGRRGRPAGMGWKVARDGKDEEFSLWLLPSQAPWRPFMRFCSSLMPCVPARPYAGPWLWTRPSAKATPPVCSACSGSCPTCRAARSGAT